MRTLGLRGKGSCQAVHCVTTDVSGELVGMSSQRELEGSEDTSLLPLEPHTPGS